MSRTVRTTSDVEAEDIDPALLARLEIAHPQLEAICEPAGSGATAHSVLAEAMAGAGAVAGADTVLGSAFGGEVRMASAGGPPLDADILPARLPPPPQPRELRRYHKTVAVRERLARTVRGLEAFAGLPPALFELAVDAMEATSMQMGERVISSREPLTHFYAVESGAFRTTSDRVDEAAELACDDIGPGGFFAEGALYEKSGGGPVEALGYQVHCVSEEAIVYRLAAEDAAEIRRRQIDEHDAQPVGAFLVSTGCMHPEPHPPSSEVDVTDEASAAGQAP